MIAIHAVFNVITVRIETLHDLHTLTSMKWLINLSQVILSFPLLTMTVNLLSSNTYMDNALLTYVITLKWLCNDNFF